MSYVNSRLYITFVTINKYEYIICNKTLSSMFMHLSTICSSLLKDNQSTMVFNQCNMILFSQPIQVVLFDEKFDFIDYIYQFTSPLTNLTRNQTIMNDWYNIIGKSKFELLNKIGKMIRKINHYHQQFRWPLWPDTIKYIQLELEDDANLIKSVVIIKDIEKAKKINIFCGQHRQKWDGSFSQYIVISTNNGSAIKSTRKRKNINKKYNHLCLSFNKREKNIWVD